jgi:hypothetical protein
LRERFNFYRDAATMLKAVLPAGPSAMTALAQKKLSAAAQEISPRVENLRIVISLVGVACFPA